MVCFYLVLCMKLMLRKSRILSTHFSWTSSSLISVIEDVCAWIPYVGVYTPAPRVLFLHCKIWTKGKQNVSLQRGRRHALRLDWNATLCFIYSGVSLLCYIKVFPLSPGPWAPFQESPLWSNTKAAGSWHHFGHLVSWLPENVPQPLQMFWALTLLKGEN